MSQSTVYAKTLASLNPAQRDAVHSIEGPLMIIAGPGTGKTHVLAARIAHILEETDTPPYAILALTFTESAAINMRNRIVNMIGKAGYYIHIQTFHAFCVDIIKTHPEYFAISRGSEALSDLEKYEIFEEILKKEQLSTLKPLNMPFFYIKDCIFAISQLKREGVSPEAFKEILDEEFSDDMFEGLKKTEEKKKTLQKDKNYELLHIYKAYQQSLRDRLRFDFDDMISLVVDAFKDNELLLLEYQEKLHYFLVDEYQDTNSAQNSIVDLLATYWGDQANICVVGDPNQSIFRFQGASIENSLSFVKRYPEAKIVTLDIGYRCSQVLYDGAHAVIQENKLTQAEGIHELHTAVSQKLTNAAKQKGENISIAQLPSQTLERIYIAESIKKLIQKGTPAEEIAVIYKNNAEVVELQHALEKWGIPYEVEGGENILEAEMIRQLLQYMLVLKDIKTAKEDEKLFEIMSYDWVSVDPVLTMKIARTAGKAKCSIIDVIDNGYEFFMKNYGRDDVKPLDFIQAENFVEKLKGFLTDDAKMVFTEWFEHFIKESGYLDHILLQENKIELLMNINSLFKEIKSLVADHKDMKLGSFLAAILVMKEHKMSIFAEDVNVQKGVVHVSTAHKSKGREWDYVFLMNCVDGTWGNTRPRDLIKLPEGLLKNTDISKKERNEDDRRLFYVVLTRARKNVSISYALTTSNSHASKQAIVSMFVEEIPEVLRKDIDVQEYSDDSVEHMITLLEKQPEVIVKYSDEAFFADLISNFALSVTALNTYLKDQDEFVRNILLKVPRAKAPPMAFGTAVHYALEKFNTALLSGDSLSKENFVSLFEKALQNELLTDEEFEKRNIFGKKVLEQYFETYAESAKKPIFVEKFIGYGFSKAVFDGTSLTGRIDKVELIDGTEKSARVIDYKTGKPRTHNEIEGKTASSDLSEREKLLPESIRGPYKRQLLFYRLLADLDQTFPYKVEEGVFDFVQPDPQTGKFTQRSFIIKDEDVNDLKNLIRDVMKEIRSLSFLKNEKAL